MSEPESLPPVPNDAPLSVLLIAPRICPDAPEILTAWQSYLSSLPRSSEILLVGPEDSADLLALRDQTSSQGIQILTYPGAEGDGNALRAGLPMAQHPLLLYAPLDRQYQPQELDRLLAAIHGVHLVCGVRLRGPIPGWVVGWDLVKGLLARVLLGYHPRPRETWLDWAGWKKRWLARWIYGLRLRDVECTFRLFRREVFQQFPLQARGSFVHLEILAKANHLVQLMEEVPVSWMPPLQPPEDPLFSLDASLVFRHPEFFDLTRQDRKEQALKTAAP